MTTVIVSEDDAHAVVVNVRHTHSMVAVRRREQNDDARNDVVPGAENSKKAQACGEATEPLRTLSSGFHRRRRVGRDTCWVKMANREMAVIQKLADRSWKKDAGNQNDNAKAQEFKDTAFTEPSRPARR
ncbi:MAG: hypothetical protein M3505_08875 [Verrucomicrobiota bacterium]|nr:hypothetical protein [Verrucomicrobiota bacterium]